MAIHFNYTSQFEEARSRIEQHLYDSILAFKKDFDLASVPWTNNDFAVTILDVDDN